MLLLASYLSANRSFYKNAVLAKESKCDAFIKCITSLTNCFYTISASLALEVRGGGSMLKIFVKGGEAVLKCGFNCRVDLNTAPTVHDLFTK